MLPGRGQARALEDAEEIGFADVESLLEECGVGLGQGLPLAAEFAGSVLDRRAFRGVFGTGPVGGRAFVEVSAADLVAALHWGIGLLEQAREFLGASHR